MRVHWKFIGLGVALITAWILGSCSESPTDVPVPNRRPTIAISAGPIRDSVNIFIATFNWNASDEDGQVVRFLFAIDDTTEWIETVDYETTLLFTATQLAGADSVRIGFGEIFRVRYRFRDAHTFYIKAIDDDGDFSPISALSFNAETIAPETGILNPSPSGTASVGQTFTVTWGGIDIDGTEDPVAYSYRLVQVESTAQIDAAEAESTLFDPASPGDPWSPFEPRTSVRLQGLEVPQDYIFGVIAMDQAGAIEPHLRTSEVPSFSDGFSNVLKVRALEDGGLPSLCVSSAVKMTCFPTADSARKTFQIPANSNVTFTWTADATPYGGTIAGYSYGLDLDDPQNFSDPGWQPESANLTRAVIRYDLPEGTNRQDRFLYVRARDDIGTVVIADVNLVVIPLSQNRDVLFVDDFGPDRVGRVYDDCIPVPTEGVSQSADTPHDQCHDQFFRESIDRGLELIGHPEWIVDQADPLNPSTGAFEPAVPTLVDMETNPYWHWTGPITLEVLSQYKAVVWNLASAGTTQLAHMNQEGQDNFLAIYLEAGGHVWIVGQGTYSRARTELEAGSGTGFFGMDGDDFTFRFLHVESEFEGPDCIRGCFRAAGTNQLSQRNNGFDAALAHPMARSEGFPTGDLQFEIFDPRLNLVIMPVEREPYSLPGKGVPNGEAICVPLGISMNTQLQVIGGRLDTLYFYLSNGRVQLQPQVPSYMDFGASGLRYSGPGQGRLMMFGFPIYYFPSKIDSLTSASFTWLFEP